MYSEGILRLRKLFKLKGKDKTTEVRQEQGNLIRKYYGTDEYKWLTKTIRRESRLKVIQAGSFTNQEWIAIIKSQDNKCKYCGREFTEKLPPTIDHIIPLKPYLAWYGSRISGRHEAKNIVAACRQCNAKKNNKLNYK